MLAIQFFAPTEGVRKTLRSQKPRCRSGRLSLDNDQSTGRARKFRCQSNRSQG